MQTIGWKLYVDDFEIDVAREESDPNLIPQVGDAVYFPDASGPNFNGWKVKSRRITYSSGGITVRLDAEPL